MKKKTLWKDIKKCFLKSKGRFFSIMCLIALGSFALVGLQIAGPDMRQTGEHYFNQLNLADVSIIGDYGIDEENQKAIDQVSGAAKIKYGYLKDVVIRDTINSIRIFSNSYEISTYEVIDGRLPKTDNEIAIANLYNGEYHIGDTIAFTEKEDISGETALKNDEFKIVGFVNSGELLSIINMGQSTAGTGELQGYAVVASSVFDSDVYMIARILFEDTKGVDPYSDQYTELIQNHKNELDQLLSDQPNLRLSAIRKEYQEQIDDGQAELDDAKQELADAKEKLENGGVELTDAKEKYADGLAEYETQKADTEQQLADAKEELDTAAKQIADGESELIKKQQDFTEAESDLKNARTELDNRWDEYNDKSEQIKKLKDTKSQLDKAQAEYEAGVSAAEAATGMTIEQIEAALPALKNQLPKAQYDQLAGLMEAKNTLAQKWAEYNAAAAGAEGAEAQLATAKQTLESRETEYSAKSTELESGRRQLSEAKSKLASGKQSYQNGIKEYNAKKVEAETKLSVAKTELDDAAVKIADSEKELTDGWKEFEEKKPDADQKIADAEVKLSDAREAMSNLKLPVYALDTRREVPGSEGYRIYNSVSNIIDSLADIFPIFLYLVAALVTLTTMTRFVDEERMNSGTLKALGYNNKDIIKKFTVYGFIASIIGAAIGIIAGHTLLPLIVYNAYGHSFSFPKIELHFYLGISIIAVILALVSTVVPAYIVAHRELREKPSILLQPKPPEAGSKIFLERIRPVWNRMSFTHKVTARNIFRYKKRMLMTIFGVCGAATLLFAGFSVQHSISGVNDRQFGEIIQYDLIVAKNDNLNAGQTDEINRLLTSDKVNQQLPILYDEMTKVAGNNQDKQDIKLIVPENSGEFKNYINLVSRRTGEELKLSDNGAVISERLAKLLNVKVGDTITVMDSKNHEREIRVDNITEMYTGHFIFMNKDCYQTVFFETYSSNANLVTLNDRSAENANEQASEFMKLDGVKGVVQNTTLTNQINTIVRSLNKIMQILIIVAVLLAVVILYNLTNINISERIRELSTIKVLGFYNKEVTMYIYRETIILTVLGILAGFGLGDALYLYIISIVPPDDVMFNSALGAKAFLVPLIVICIITIVLGFMNNRRLKNVNMLEALKSVE